MTGATDSMLGVIIHGKKTLSLKEFAIPEPGPGQVLLKMQASSICGSDLRALYRPDVPKNFGPDGYRGVVAGHEPCGQIAKVGPAVSKNWKLDDRVVVYHIHGCGTCRNCRLGLYISCLDPEDREAYGWQRNGGHSEYILADATDLVRLPTELSYIDGSMIACGLGTSYAATVRAEISGRDVVFITGLGPVGIGCAILAQKEGAQVYGFEINTDRIKAAQKLGIKCFSVPDKDAILNEIEFGPSVVIDASGNPDARNLCLQVCREWGRCVFVGEGNTMTFDVSELVIHKNLAIYGSWVCSISQMEDLVEKLGRWKLSPESVMVTHVYPLTEAEEAYREFDLGGTGKVALVSPQELARWQTSHQ